MQVEEQALRRRRARAALAVTSAAVVGVFGAGTAYALVGAGGAATATPVAGAGGHVPLAPRVTSGQPAAQLPQAPAVAPAGASPATSPAGTDCSQGGLSGATLAYQLYDTANPGAPLTEDGGYAAQWYASVESQAPAQLQPGAHEVGCGIAALEATAGSAPSPGGGVPGPLQPIVSALQQALAQNAPAPAAGDVGGTDCASGGVNGPTLAYQLYQAANPDAPLTEDSGYAAQWYASVESQVPSQLTPAAHEVGCGIAALEAESGQQPTLPAPGPGNPPVPVPGGGGLPSIPPTGTPLDQVVQTVTGLLPGSGGVPLP